jgi:hypothetical protein
MRKLGFCLCLGIIALATGVVKADPADYLGDLEAELIARDGELTGDLEKAEKKTKKSIGKALKQLDKLAPDADLADVSKTASKVAGALKKVLGTESGLAGEMDGAADKVETAVGDELASLQDRIDGLAEGKGKDKAQKKKDKADAKFEAARAQADHKKKFKGLRSAVKKVPKVEKAIAKAGDGGGGGGGGGGGTCDEGRPLGGTESFSGTVAGVAYVPNNIDTEVDRDPQTNAVTRVGVSFYRCAGGKKSLFTLNFPEVPQVKKYNLGLFQGDAYMFYADDLPGFGQVLFGGVDTYIEVTSFDAGTGRLKATYQLPDSGGGFGDTIGTIDVVIDVP